MKYWCYRFFKTVLSITALLPALAAVLLQSTAAHAEFTLEPTDIDFGRVRIGFSDREVVVLKNVGKEKITLHIRDSFCDKEITYIASSCFRIISPNKFCHIEVYFQPTRREYRECYLRVTDSLKNKEVISVVGRGF